MVCWLEKDARESARHVRRDRSAGLTIIERLLVQVPVQPRVLRLEIRPRFGDFPWQHIPHTRQALVVLAIHFPKVIFFL